MLTWLYDLRLENQTLHFVLFRVWTVHVTAPEDIEQVREVGYFSIGAWNAYNFKNRLFARTFLITLRHGWFTRKIQVTPADSPAFVNWCIAHGISVSTVPR